MVFTMKLKDVLQINDIDHLRAVATALWSSQNLLLQRLKQFADRYSFKYQMRLTSFVHNTDMLGIDLCQTRISRTLSFIQQQMVRFRPRHSLVETDLQCMMSPAFLRVRISE